MKLKRFSGFASLMVIVLLLTSLPQSVAAAMYTYIDEDFSDYSVGALTLPYRTLDSYGTGGNHGAEILNADDAPAGGSGKVLRTFGDTGHLRYGFGTITEGTVTVEARVYVPTTNNIQVVLGGNTDSGLGAYFVFKGGEVGYYKGNDTATDRIALYDSTGKKHTYSTKTWQNIKIEMSKSENGYDQARYFIQSNGTYKEMFPEAGAPQVRSSVGAINHVLFNSANAAGGIYVDWIKVSTESQVATLPLEKVANVRWEKEVLQWDFVENGSNYEVILYKDGLELDKKTVSDTTLDFSQIMLSSGSGSYTATVQAKGYSGIYADGPVSDHSVAYDYQSALTKLGQVEKPVWSGTVLKWKAADNASYYQVNVYKGGTQVFEKKVGGTSQPSVDLTNNLAKYGTGQYTATVQAMGDMIAYLHGDVSAVSDSYSYSYELTDNTLLFFDDFESPDFQLGSLDGQRNNAWQADDFTGGTIQVVTQEEGPDGYTGGNLARLTMVQNGEGTFKRKFDPVTGQITIKLKIYAVKEHLTSIFIGAQPAIQLRFNNNGKLRYRNANSTWIDFGKNATFKDKAWNDLEVVLSKNDDAVQYSSARILLNGADVGAASDVFRNKTDSISSIGINDPANGNTNSVYFDDIAVYALPEEVDATPKANNVGIITENSGLLTGNYEYYNEMGTAEGQSSYRWLTAATAGGTFKPIDGATGRTYQMTEADYGKYIKFEVTPRSIDGLPGEAVQSAELLPGFKPVAQNVTYTKSGNTFIGQYEYFHFGGTPEDKARTKYRWLLSESENGLYIPVADAVSETFVLPNNQKNKYIKFEVTPVSNRGEVGDTVQSSGAPDANEETYVIIAANALTFASLSSQKNDRVTANLTLPENGLYDTAISWSSSDPSIVSSAGVVSQPDYGESRIVTLTATFTKDGKQQIKYFKLSVPSKYGLEEGGNRDTPSYIGGAPVGEVATFLDVPTSHWANSYVEYLYTNKIVSGISTNYYEPDKGISKEEFCAMLVRAFQLKTGEQPLLFEDVLPDSWYYESVKAAYNNDIVQGVSATLFGTGAQMTRQDMAVITARLYGKLDIPTAGTGYEFLFVDDEQIAPYARDSVYQMYQLQVVAGDETGAFRPLNVTTRAEAAKIICLMHQAYSE